MAKSSPLSKVLKKLEALQVKSEKIVGELSDLTKLVADMQSNESAPNMEAGPKNPSKQSSSISRDTTDAPKRRGRPKQQKEIPALEVAPKKRGRKPKIQ